MAERPNRHSLDDIPPIDLSDEVGKRPAIDIASVADALEKGDEASGPSSLVVPDPVSRTEPIYTGEQAQQNAAYLQQAPVASGRGAGGRSGRIPRVSQGLQDGVAAQGQGVPPQQYQRGYVPQADQPDPTGQFVPVVPGKARNAANTHSRDDAHYNTGEPKKRNWWKILLILLLAAAVAYGIAWVIKENMKDNWDLSIKVDSSNQVYETLTPTVSRDPFYMMLIGSDSRNDDENERSDTNIVARVDPTTGTVNIISIPRDTAINYDNYGTVKFNAAYAYDGASGAIRAAEGLLGVKITHYAEIDFSGLVNLVDAMGGVAGDVPMRIEDANAGSEIIEAGPQHLNGAQALVFARSRSYANGDYQRTANQRILVEAMLHKIMGMNDFEMAPIIEQLSNYMSSDMGVRQMQDYAILFRDYPEELKIYSTVMPSDVAYDDEGTSYVVCDTTTLRQVMELVNQAQDPSALVTNDSAVYSSAEAQDMGMESTPIYVPD